MNGHQMVDLCGTTRNHTQRNVKKKSIFNNLFRDQMTCNREILSTPWRVFFVFLEFLDLIWFHVSENVPWWPCKELILKPDVRTAWQMWPLHFTLLSLKESTWSSMNGPSGEDHFPSTGIGQIKQKQRELRDTVWK